MIDTQTQASEGPQLSHEVGELFAAISKATGLVNEAGVKKTGEFKSQRAGNYKYAGSADIFDPVDAAMAATGLGLVALSVATKTVYTADEKSRWVIVDVEWLLTHSSGQWLRTSSHGESYSQAWDDKAHAKALTAAQKAVNRLLFNIATKEDDNDAHDPSSVDSSGKLKRRKQRTTRQKKGAPDKSGGDEKAVKQAPQKSTYPPVPADGEVWFEVAAKKTGLDVDTAKAILKEVAKKHAGEKSKSVVWNAYVDAISAEVKKQASDANTTKETNNDEE